MEKISSFIKGRWWSFASMLTLVLLLVIFFFSLPWMHSITCSTRDYLAYYHCDETISWPVIRFILSAFVGAFALVFVRETIAKKIVFFSVIYAVFSIIFLSNVEPSGWLSSEQREMYAIVLGLSLSAISILWSVIHTLILRHKDKKNQQQKA